MERPSGPRRKSSASEADDLQAKTKANRKSFVVGGGASKNHHRVPSYGKKLNQLGKLTALTTTDQKTPEVTAVDTSRRASLHRSHSHKSLVEHKVSKRTGSSQNLQKLGRSTSHHGSSARLSGLKPMTKVADRVDDSKEPETQEDSTDSKLPLSSTAMTTNKRATFVIEDDDDDGDDADDVASSFAQKALIHDDLGTSADRQRSQESSSLPQHEKSGVRENSEEATRVDALTEEKQEEDLREKATHSASNPVGLLLSSSKRVIDPQLNTDAAVSRDLQSKDAPSTARIMAAKSAQMTPVNSQPLTSRFLESPRKESLPSNAHLSFTQGKDTDANLQTSTTSTVKPALQQIYHSPHGSTTNLGAGASRTQQKLLLQRASSIRDLDGEIEDKEGTKGHFPAYPRAQKEFDRVSREYKNARRFRDPLKELSSRLYTRGIGRDQNLPLRRTMTQMAMNGHASELRTPKQSQSSTNLRQPHPVKLSRTSSGEDVSKILQLLWIKDDHIPSLEE